MKALVDGRMIRPMLEGLVQKRHVLRFGSPADAACGKQAYDKEYGAPTNPACLPP
jgi:hypothetical protein